MKNPFAKIFTPDYEKNIEKMLDSALYDARTSFIAAVEAKQRSETSLTYFTNRVDTLNKALQAHKAQLRD